MKALRIAMMAVLVAVTMVSLANADGFGLKPAKKLVILTFEKAIQIPGMVTVMYQQIDENMMNNCQHTYTAEVEFKGYTCRITGTYDQWTLFFKMKWQFSSPIKQNVIDN